MDAVSDPAIETVVVKSSAQVGKTLILKAIIGYHVHQDPAPILLLQPTLEMAETFSKDRLAPMVRDTPVLRGKIADPRSRDSGNTLLHKRFPGGHITLAGANSAASLASRPIRIVLCDEVDRYPASAGTEGDPVSLARKRTATFWNRKVVLTSTPTKKGLSRIDAAWEQSDQRRYEVPCPHCGHFHVLEWANIRYAEGEPAAAKMACPECGGQFGDEAKPRMLRLGRWVAAEPFRGVAGFHISELYSPWRTFGQVATDYERAKDQPEQLKTFVNTSLGETYEEPTEAPEYQRLYDRRERYSSNVVPADVVLLTAGVDVQGDRLEVDIVGWAPGKETYQIDYRVLLGDTANLDDPNGAWPKLQTMINTEQWECEAGPTMGLRCVAVDSGFRTTTVYDFCRRFPAGRVIPIKGRAEQVTLISRPLTIDVRRDGKSLRFEGLKYYTVGVSVAKAEFYGWLRLDRAEDGTAPPGYPHFNEDRDLQYFKELTSERVQIKMDTKGFPKEQWVRDPKVRNEPLDCRVYARAAAAFIGVDRWKEKDWQVKKEKRGAAPAAPAAPPPKQEPVRAEQPAQVEAKQEPQAEQPVAKKSKKKRRGGSYVLGNRGSFW